LGLGLLGDADGLAGDGAEVDGTLEEGAAVFSETAPLLEVDPEVDAGVAAGAEAGNVVSGVGSGGKGFVSILATISFMPASD